MKIAQGESQQYKATAVYNILPQYKPDITNDPNTTWTAGNTGVATLNTASKGYATGIAPGRSYIWCDYKGVPSTPAAMLEVGPPRATMTIAPNPAYLSNWGDRVSFTATVTYSDSSIPSIMTTSGVTWSCNTYGIVKSWTLPNMFELQTYNNGTTTVSATSIVADRYSGKFLTASATLIYGDPNKNPCGLTYVPYRQNDNFPINDSQYNSTYPQHLNNYWTDLPFANHTTAETVPPRIKGGVLPASIGDVGCLMVSAAMALTSTGTPVDPGQLNAYLNGVPRGYVSREVNFDWIVAYAGSKITNVSPSWISTTSVNQDIITALTACNLVILQVSGNDGYFATHFVLATAYKNNKIYIYDPWWRYKAGDSPMQLDELNARYNITAYKILTVK